MKTKLLTLFLSILSSTALAYEFTVGGLYYNIITDVAPYTVELTYLPSPGGSRLDNYSHHYTKNVVIPQEVTYNKVTYKVVSIGELAFVHYKALDSIVIPDGIVKIGDGAFKYCDSLKSVSIPNTVKSIGSDAFSGCTSLTKTNFRGSISDWCRIKIGTWGNPLEYSNDFYIYNKKVEDLIIPSNVDSIYDYAFNGCSVRTVNISKSVKHIGVNAFHDCENLQFITSHALIPPAIDELSLNSNPLCYIPCGTFDAYFASDWKKYCYQFIEQSSVYDITLLTNNTYGIAKVASRPDCNSAILTAIPNEGCTFVKWSDGNTQSTRYIEVTEDITLTAEFVKKGYAIHVYQDCNTTIE